MSFLGGHHHLRLVEESSVELKRLRVFIYAQMFQTPDSTATEGFLFDPLRGMPCGYLQAYFELSVSFCQTGGPLPESRMVLRRCSIRTPTKVCKQGPNRNKEASYWEAGLLRISQKV